VQQANPNLGGSCDAENGDWERWCDTPGEQNLGMPIQGKVRLLLVMEVYEDEGRPTGTMRVCEEDDNGVKWRELGCAERCLSEKTSGSPLILFEDGKEKVRTNDRDVSIVGCSGGTTMLEEEEDEMVAREKSGASSFPCNAVSICNKDGENLSIEARRRSLLGLIPVKISTSKPWDLRLDTQSLSNCLSDSAMRNCNMMFWMNNEHSEAFRVWYIGKELGFSFSGEKDVAIGRLQAMEMRDKSKVHKRSRSRVENNLSDDEAN